MVDPMVCRRAGCEAPATHMSGYCSHSCEDLDEAEYPPMLCARPGCGQDESRIHGYCSCECERLHEVEVERDMALAALRELVWLKDLKDCSEHEAEDYRRRKPLAWQAARQVLADCAPLGEA